MTPRKTPSLALARAQAEARTRIHLDGTSGRVTPDARAPFGFVVDLDIKVEDLQEELVVQETLPQAWLQDLLADPSDPPWRTADDAHIDVLLEREAATVKVTGEGRFALAHACVRCLRDVRFDLAVGFDLRLAEGAAGEPNAEELQDDEEMESFGADDIDPAEADLFPFDGRRVPLGAIIREQVFLELPMHPQCESEGAKPLPGPCTLDPDGALAREQARWQDPRWAGLLALKDQLPKGRDEN
ncbi:MAG: YceD family protein [Myxococcota bacterium]